METLTPTELQFYTSAAAATLQMPLVLYLHGSEIFGTDLETPAPGSLEGGFLAQSGVMLLVFVACCFYHLQSVAAYYCVNSVSPVTMSVANTLKRGLLIALSIVWFGNTVTLHTYGGMAMIVGGVAFYNRVVTEEKQRSKREASSDDIKKRAGGGAGGGGDDRGMREESCHV